MGFVTSTSLRVTCFVCYKNFQDRNLHGRKNRLSVCILYLGRPTDTQHRSCFVCLCSKMYHSPDCWACIKRCFFLLIWFCHLFIAVSSFCFQLYLMQCLYQILSAFQWQVISPGSAEGFQVLYSISSPENIRWDWLYKYFTKGSCFIFYKNFPDRISPGKEELPT